MQLEENRKALEDLQLKLKETDENEQQLRIKSEFSL